MTPSQYLLWFRTLERENAEIQREARDQAKAQKRDNPAGESDLVRRTLTK
jgi:hypothetical protein